MGHRNPNQQGPKLPVDVLVGVTVPKLRGVNLEQDPAAILPVQHQYLVNVRLNEDGIFVCRGGLAKVTTTPVAQTIRGVWDASPEGHTDQVAALPPPPAAVLPPAGSGQPVPPSTFTVLRPSAQGFYNQYAAGPFAGYGTPAGYSKVTALADEDGASYVWNNSGPQDNTWRDSYAMTDLAGSVASVSKVVLVTKLFPEYLNPRGSGGLGPTTLRLGVRLGGVDSYSPYYSLSAQGADTIRHDFTAARPGGGAWSAADVNAVECIIQSDTPAGGSNPGFAFLWLEVTHPV